MSPRPSRADAHIGGICASSRRAARSGRQSHSDESRRGVQALRLQRGVRRTPSGKRIDSQKIKTHFNAKKLRFASADELLQLTGLVPGSVPPFGKPILPFDLYVDTSIVHNTKIAFNAGSLTDSIIMATRDYLQVANAETFEFTNV